MYLKKFSVWILVLAAGIVLFSCGGKNSSDTSWKDIQKKGSFIVGLDDSFPPMGFRDEKGEIVGFDIDMAKAAAQLMGVKVEFKPVDWNGVILSLGKKDIDVIWNGLTITDERKQKIAFSQEYMENHQIIVVKAGSKITDKEGLAKKTIGLQMGSSSENALASDTNLTKSLKAVRKYSNNTEALLDLKAGRIDAVVVDEIVGRYYIAKKPGDYAVLADNLGTEAYGVGLRIGDTNFLNKLDAAISTIKTNGTGDEISKKWFGETILTK